MWQIAGILLIGLCTRIYHIANKELWYDEILDILQAQKNVLEIFKDVTITPLHYLFVHLATLFTDSVDLLRIPSVLFGVASILLLYLLVRKISSEQVALLSAFLLALSPMHIEFSQQILHYSFFVFFTLLTLYFYVDLINGHRWKSLSVAGFGIATALNVLTHMSSILVIAIELGVLTILHILTIRKHVSTFLGDPSLKKKLTLSLLIGALGLIFIQRLDYFSPYLLYSSFDLSKPIPLGFSLSGQLNSTLLYTYSLEFFKAMLIWIGFGKGVGYILPLAFAISGFVALRRRPRIAFFALCWLAGPFIILYITRMSHWFEEKYFIFVIPIYLYVIAEGVIALIQSATNASQNKRSYIWLCTICYIGFLALAITPIQTRTTYGYRVKGDPGYAWTKVISYVKRHGRNADMTFIDDIYGQIYLGKRNRNKTWFSEQSIVQFSTREYDALVHSRKTHFYASIPDIQDMRIGSIVTSSPKKVVGGINVYTVQFLRARPELHTTPYIDNFMRMDYLKNATRWKNVLLTFDTVLSSPYPQTELDNLLYLVPSTAGNSSIDYDFRVDRSDTPTYFRINYVAAKPGVLEIALGKNHPKPIRKSRSGAYTDEIYDVTQYIRGGNLNTRLIFKYPYKEFKKTLIVGIKSIGIMHDLYTPPRLEVLDGMYVYDAGLTGIKSTKWWTDSSRNFGWVQTKHGDLYRRFGSPDNTLDYTFTIPGGARKGSLILKTFTAKNKITVEASSDGKQYIQITRHSRKLSDFTEQIALDSFLSEQSRLYLRFRTDISNQDAAIRSFRVEVH